MQNLIQHIAIFINLLKKTIFSFSKVIVFSKSVREFNKLKINTEKLIILGNGPSLNKSISENKDLLINSDLMAVNYFAKSEYYTLLKPKYYVIIDRFVFADSYDADSVDQNTDFFTKISEYTDWDMILFIPVEAKKHKNWKAIIQKNKNIKICYINLTPIEGFKSIIFRFYNKNLGMPRPHNVLIPAIYIALKLEVKEIFLFGADHSWLKDLYVDDNNVVMVKDQHFYDSGVSKRQYFYNTKQGKKAIKYHEALYTFMIAFSSYYFLKDYADYKKAKITNCTPQSFIDAFEKVSIDNVGFKPE